MKSEFFERLSEILPEGVLRDEPMAAHTTWRVGGKADLFLSPADGEELRSALLLLADAGVPWYPVGAGSNLLVRDGGFRGAVIHLGRMRQLRFEGCEAEVGAGVPLMHLIRETAARGLAGLEELAGIPGTLGGGIAMNAGAGEQDLAGVVVSVTVLGPEGERVLSTKDLSFGYRRASLPEGTVVTSSRLKFTAADAQSLQEVVRARLARRRQAQGVGGPNAGSVFKNPPGLSAWKLIVEAGMKGEIEGGAQISPVHANFIINRGGASARDILALIDRCRRAVAERSGVLLETEVRIVGEDQ